MSRSKAGAKTALRALSLRPTTDPGSESDGALELFLEDDAVAPRTVHPEVSAIELFTRLGRRSSIRPTVSPPSSDRRSEAPRESKSPSARGRTGRRPVKRLRSRPGPSKVGSDAAFASPIQAATMFDPGAEAKRPVDRLKTMADELNRELASIPPKRPAADTLSSPREIFENALDHLLPLPGAMVPADLEVLARLWPAHLPMIPSHTLKELIEGQLSRGTLKRQIVGTEWHLARRERTSVTMASPVTSDAAVAVESEEVQASRVFNLQVAIDAEEERALLFKVLIVLEAIVLTLLARGLVLRWLEG